MGRGRIIEGSGYFNLIKDSSPVVSQMHHTVYSKLSRKWKSKQVFLVSLLLKKVKGEGRDGEGRLFEGASIFWPRKWVLIWGYLEGAYSKKYGMTDSFCSS